MRKILVLISILSLTLCVCGFAKNNEVIRNKATELYTQLNTILEEKNAENVETEATSEASSEASSTPAEDNTEEQNAEINYTVEELEILVNSNDYDSWNTVTLGTNATSDQLQAIAKKCAEITDNKSWAQTIATNISKNQNSNDSVINELSNSNYYSVLNISANSELANTLTLTNIAKKCAAIDNSQSWAQTIATSISKNSNADDSVMKELVNSPYPSIINVVIGSDKSSESTLQAIAKKCAAIDNDKNWAQTLAASISKSSVSNDAVMNELTISPYYTVLNIVAKSEHSGTLTLTNVAKRCAEIADNQNWARTIATSISKNNNTNTDIMKELANTQSYTVLKTIIESNHLDASILQIIAKRCAAIDNDKNWAQTLATGIAKNSVSNDEIMNELSISPYYTVLNVAANSKYSGEITLTSIAKRCAEITDNQNWAQTIAASLSNNDNITSDILSILSTSSYDSVSKLGKTEAETE